MPRIRPSRDSDAERVFQIWRDAVDATHDFLDPADRIAIEEEVKLLLPALLLWIAADGSDRPIGFMALSDDGHMDALFVDPACRGTGVGRSLVSHAARLHPSLTIDVNEQNPQAIGFYRRMGFVPTGRSEVDGQNRPYPLIHLRLARGDEGASGKAPDTTE